MTGSRRWRNEQSVDVALRRQQPKLSLHQLEGICELLKKQAGIELGRQHETLIRSRLTRRLATIGIPSFDEYLVRVASDPVERRQMLEVLTTNKTSFFREIAQFEYLRQHMRLDWHRRQLVRAWSAGCSTGEEPYSLAMLTLTECPGVESHVLATDLSHSVLQVASRGVYGEETMEGVPAAMRDRFFRRDELGKYSAKEVLRESVVFRALNLMGPWRMRGPLQAILCRNVMIYFDKATQTNLARRFWNLLEPDGLFFLGHSETLGADPEGFRLVQPAVYRKIDES